MRLSVEETLRNLKQVEEKYKIRFTPTGEVNISEMARDCIGTIEALQAENERLKEQINTAKIGWDTYKTYSEQTVELLRKARKALHKGISELKVHSKYFDQTPEEDACIEMHEAIVEIDKVIAGTI